MWESKIVCYSLLYSYLFIQNKKMLVKKKTSMNFKKDILRFLPKTFQKKGFSQKGYFKGEKNLIW